MLSRGWMHAILSLRRRLCSLPPALHPRRQLIPAGACNGWRSRSLCRLCAWLSWQGGLWAGGRRARGPPPAVHADPSPAELLEQIRNGRGVLQERSQVLRLLLLGMQAAWELGRQPAQRHGGKGTDLPDIINNKRRKKGGRNFLEYFYLFIIPSLPTLTGGRPLLQTFWNRSIIISFENNKYHGVPAHFGWVCPPTPPGAAAKVSRLESWCREEAGDSHWPGHQHPGSINLGKMFLRIKAKRVEIDRQHQALLSFTGSSSKA